MAASARVAKAAVGAVLALYPRRDRQNHKRSADEKKRRRAKSKSRRLQADDGTEGCGVAKDGGESAVGLSEQSREPAAQEAALRRELAAAHERAKASAARAKALE